jgi:hypothetical protein
MEALGCVTAKGHPNAEALAALDALASAIAVRHNPLSQG